MPAAAAIAVVAASAYSANRQASAANKAANAQVQSGDSAVAEEQRQFDAIQEMLAAWRETGANALTSQEDLIGLNGTEKQAAAIRALESSPGFTSLLARGENSILQNASATGGLRGGNTQAALAEFSPALLSATINDQYSRLGGLSQQGLGAATQTGAFGQASTNNVTNLMQQIGAARAGGALGVGRGRAGYANAITQGIGAYTGFGGSFGGAPGQVSAGQYGANPYFPNYLGGGF